MGEVADLFIPPYLAYGAGGAAAGLVPPHAAALRYYDEAVGKDFRPHTHATFA